MSVWDGMTVEDLANCYSDIHKEAYGFRPRWTIDTTREALIEELEHCGRVIDENNKQEAIAQAQNVAKLEADIQTLIGMGATDRQTAIRWIADAEDAGDDLEYLCYLRGLPYRYFASLAI